MMEIVMKNLFIDSNIYLNFYDFSSDDLEELQKLVKSVKCGDINLIVTKQVVDEYKRNRASTIATVIKKFSEQTIPSQFPNICKAYEDEYEQLKQIVKDYSELKKALLDKIERDISSGECGADKLIQELFVVGTVQDIDEAIIQNARNRIELGNPPGKRNSLGDAIHWEFLISKIPEGEELYLISGDGDFDSRLNENNFAEFLLDEWIEKKSSGIFYYHRLSEFLKDQIPEITITSDQGLAKELAINELVNSKNFALTHAAIGNLLGYSHFSDAELEKMISACISNDQIQQILGDSDVNDFFGKLLEMKQA